MTNDASLFRTREQMESAGWTLDANTFRSNRGEVALPMWEDWMMHLFDHRYQSNGGIATTVEQRRDPCFSVEPRYWVYEADVRKNAAGSYDDGYQIGFRNRTRPTDSRTVICTVIPRSAVGQYRASHSHAS